MWLKANLAPSHGVTQLGLVVDEGHDAQVGLNKEGFLSYEEANGSPRDGELVVGLLHCLHQLDPEVVQLTEGGHLLISVGHGVLGKGHVWDVCGPGVPAVHEGGTRTLVPLDTNSITLPPVELVEGFGRELKLSH